MAGQDQPIPTPGGALFVRVEIRVTIQTWRMLAAVRIVDEEGAAAMTIELSKDLERIVREAVGTGLYATEADVIRDALVRLNQTMSKETEPSAMKAKRVKSTRQKKVLTIDEVHQRMMASGLISQLPNTAADFDDPDDEPVTIEGELLSETIIRERR
jgi:Arc/MetJ-type ribon-helix-helix transcriptional regulator